MQYISVHIIKCTHFWISSLPYIYSPQCSISSGLFSITKTKQAFELLFICYIQPQSIYTLPVMLGLGHYKVFFLGSLFSWLLVRDEWGRRIGCKLEVERREKLLSSYSSFCRWFFCSKGQLWLKPPTVLALLATTTQIYETQLAISTPVIQAPVTHTYFFKLMSQKNYKLP